MRKRKNRYGLTLVELIIAFAIIVLVFAAIVPQFRAIRNSWASTEAKSEIIQNGRVLAEHITRNLAAAKQIVSFTSSSITFWDNNDIQKRYKLSDFDSGKYVVFGAVDSEEQLAGPVSSFQISCYSIAPNVTLTTDCNIIRLVQVDTNFPNDDALGTDKTFSSEVFIQTNVPKEQSVIDVFVKSGEPDTAFDYAAGAYGCDAVIEVDNWQNPSVIHGLLCFKDIVGNEANQVPPGQEITQAKLKLWYVNHNNNNAVYFYRMWVPWTETSTWNSIGGGVIPGTNCDPDPCRVEAYLGGNGSVQTTVEIDVTDIVWSWINGEENYGFGIRNSSNNNIQFAAAENTTGTGAHTPILEVTYHLPPDVEVIGSWVTGLTHAKESGTNRALIFIAHTEHSADVNLTGVTYGGQAMTKITDIRVGTGTSNRVYVVAYRLNESGVAAATSPPGTFALTWLGGVTPTSRSYTSVFLSNVNQTVPIGATARTSATTGTTITTSSLATSRGDMVIENATSSTTGNYTEPAGWTEDVDLGVTGYDGMDGHKFATGVNEVPSVTHPTGRHVLIGFVVKALEEKRTFGGETITILP